MSKVAALGVPCRTRRLKGAQAIEHDFQPAPGDLRRVEKLQRARRQVSGIGIGLKALVLPNLVDPLELGEAHVDLPANLDHRRNRRGLSPPEFSGKGGDGQGVGRDVVPLDAVAARDGARQPSVLIGDAYGESVDLRLHDISQIVAAEKLHKAGVKFPEFGLGVGVVQALHRLPVHIRLKSGRPVVPHPLGG